MREVENVQIVSILGLAIFYVAFFHLVSLVAITVDLWLGVKEQLGGNVAATVISTIVLVKRSKGLMSFSNPGLLTLFAGIAGLSAVAFIGCLQVASELLESHGAPAISLVDAVVVVVLNGLIFAGTVFFMERGSKKNAEP